MTSWQSLFSSLALKTLHTVQNKMSSIPGEQGPRLGYLRLCVAAKPTDEQRAASNGVLGRNNVSVRAIFVEHFSTLLASLLHTSSITVSFVSFRFASAPPSCILCDTQQQSGDHTRTTPRAGCGRIPAAVADKPPSACRLCCSPPRSPWPPPLAAGRCGACPVTLRLFLPGWVVRLAAGWDCDRGVSGARCVCGRGGGRVRRHLWSEHL